MNSKIDIAPWNRDYSVDPADEEDRFSMFVHSDEQLELIERLNCSENVIRLITDGIKAGLSELDAAVAIGISPRATEFWKARGKREWERIQETAELDGVYEPIKEEEIYLHYYLEVMRAIPLRKYYFVNRIKRAARKTWQAAAWWLERTHPEEFARKSQVEIVDWRSKIVDGIRNGSITVNMLEAEFERPDIERLFVAAGVPIPARVEGTEESGVIDGEFTDKVPKLSG